MTFAAIMLAHAVGDSLTVEPYLPAPHHSDGIPAATCGEVRLFSLGWLDGHHPETVVLMCSHNNLNRTTPAETAAAIRATQNDVHTAMSNFWFVYPPPSATDSGWWKESLQGPYLDALRAELDGVYTIDAHAIWTELGYRDRPELYVAGGVHLSEMGREALADIVLDGIAEPVPIGANSRLLLIAALIACGIGAGDSGKEVSTGGADGTRTRTP